MAGQTMEEDSVVPVLSGEADEGIQKFAAIPSIARHGGEEPMVEVSLDESSIDGRVRVLCASINNVA